MDRSDAELLAATAGGDEDAFATFYRRHERRLTRFAIARCASPDDVGDAVAETFLVALRRASAFDRSRTCAAPWLLGICVRVIAGQERARVRRSRLARRLASAPPAYPADEAARVEAAIDAWRSRDRLRRALEELPRREREILVLVAYAELSPAEAAAALGISANAARVRLARARRRLASAPLPDLPWEVACAGP